MKRLPIYSLGLKDSEGPAAFLQYGWCAQRVLLIAVWQELNQSSAEL